MSRRSRYLTRTLVAIAEASGNGVSWSLTASADDMKGEPVVFTLKRTAGGTMTHVFTDALGQSGVSPNGVTYGSYAEGRNMISQEIRRKGNRLPLTRPAGDIARAKILAAIKQSYAERGRAPSHNEIFLATGIDRKTAAYHLEVMAKLGQIEIVRGAKYTILLKEDAK